MSDKKKQNTNNNDVEEDLKNKFQRLFQEYSKIKNQNSVLKKAVIQVKPLRSSVKIVD